MPEIDIMGNITKPVFNIRRPVIKKPRKLSAVSKFYFWLRKRFAHPGTKDYYDCKLRDGFECSIDWKKCYYNCNEHSYTDYT